MQQQTLTQTALAYNKKDNRKDNGNGNTITIQKCKEAATQSGFDNNQGQECENLICTHPGLEEIFPLEEISYAYDKVSNGNVRFKAVIEPIK